MWNKENYLRSLMPTQRMIEHFINPDPIAAPVASNLRSMCNAGGSTYDAELGWIKRTCVCEDGIDGSLAYFNTEADGARKVINFAGRPCRILTFGNSFTQCSQVNDGETWQEALAAHFQEPIRNYGVGGYSVYQAYLRMRKVLSSTPAEYVILNIWDDDHFRNIDDWRSIRFGSRGRFTLPHIHVNDDLTECQEIENRCKTPDSLNHLQDFDYVWNTFKENPVLQALEIIAKKNDGKLQRFGDDELRFRNDVTARMMSQSEPDSQIRMVYVDKALAATRHVIQKARKLTEETNTKLLVILSFSRTSVIDDLRGGTRFDRSFLDWLRSESIHFIDLRDSFKSEFESIGGRDPESYLDRYYIGHHTAFGNSFFAESIRREIVEWLDPRPVPYLGT